MRRSSSLRNQPLDEDERSPHNNRLRKLKAQFRDNRDSRSPCRSRAGEQRGQSRENRRSRSPCKSRSGEERARFHEYEGSRTPERSQARENRRSRSPCQIRAGGRRGQSQQTRRSRSPCQTRLADQSHDNFRQRSPCHTQVGEDRGNFHEHRRSRSPCQARMGEQRAQVHERRHSRSPCETQIKEDRALSYEGRRSTSPCQAHVGERQAQFNENRGSRSPCQTRMGGDRAQSHKNRRNRSPCQTRVDERQGQLRDHHGSGSSRSGNQRQFQENPGRSPCRNELGTEPRQPHDSRRSESKSGTTKINPEDDKPIIGKSGRRRRRKPRLDNETAREVRRRGRSSSSSPWLNRVKMVSSSSSPESGERRGGRGLNLRKNEHESKAIADERQLARPPPGPSSEKPAAQGVQGPSFEKPEWAQGIPDQDETGIQRIMYRMTTQEFGRMDLKMTQLQVRCLIGKGGATIQSIMRATGSLIHVKTPSQVPVAEVHVSGAIGKAMAMIKDVLARNGVPYSDGEVSNADSVLEIPHAIMGELIGPRAGLLLELQERLGSDIVIQRLPHVAPGGGRPVQVAGARWREAKVAVEAWVARRTAAKGIC